MELRLRQYKSCDAENIVSWIKDEQALRKWSSDRFGDFPITSEDINDKYINHNGDCTETDNFYPLVAFDDSGVVGHFILRYTDTEKKTIRVGFVIVDDTKRGMGYGKEMLKLAIKYAFEIFKAEKVTLGVFENNLPAYYCYKAAGFKDVDMDEKEVCYVCGEEWSILELEMTRRDYSLL